ncbi:unnamed protein product [Ixodes hexagonus]
MTERRRDKRNRTCFVPGCNSGYRSCKEARSLFRVPLEFDRRETWSCNIKRGDRELHDGSVVCERHFEVRFIQRTFQTTIKDEVVEIPRDLPLLTPDAVPTIFPDAPKYISKPLPKKRKERNICDQASRDTADNEPGTAEVDGCKSPDNDREVSNREASAVQSERSSFASLRIPESWSRIALPSCEN